MNKEELETKNKAIIHKDNSLNRLDLSFIKHIELNEYKKSELLAYWIHDYAVYHDEERTFDISRSGIFQRGEVIKVNTWPKTQSKLEFEREYEIRDINDNLLIKGISNWCVINSETRRLERAEY